MQVSSRVREVLDNLDQTRGLYYNLTRPAAELLGVFAKIRRAKSIVEIGTANGYTAITLGAAVRDFGGTVITIERNGVMVEAAKRNICAAGLQDVVTVYPGSAYKVLKQLPGPFDLIFIDGTKQEYVGYFERVKDKLADNSLIIADNVMSHEEELADFIRLINEDASISSSIFPVGAGLLVGVHCAPQKQIKQSRTSSLNELVVQAAPRIFRGTVSQVHSGEIFDALEDIAEEEMEGYEKALFEEALRLPD